MQLHISYVLAANNSTTQLHTRLNLCPFQWAYITILCTFSLPEVSRWRMTLAIHATAALAQGEAPWVPDHSQAAMSSDCSHQLMLTVLLPGGFICQATIMSLGLMVITRMICRRSSELWHGAGCDPAMSPRVGFFSAGSIPLLHSSLWQGGRETKCPFHGIIEWFVFKGT